MTQTEPPEASVLTGGPPAEDPSNRSREDLTRKAVKAVAWNGVQLWGYNLVGLGVFVVLGRLLDPRDFGLAAAAMVVIMLLRIVVDAGFSRLLVQRAELDSSLVDTAFWTACLLGLAFTAIIAAAAPVFALLFDQPRLTALIRGLSLIFVFAALDSTPTALLQRELQWRTLALRRLAATAASAFVAVWLALSGAGAWALVGQQLVLEGLTVAFLWFATSWRPARRFSRLALAELLTFGARYSVLRILWYLGANLDNFLIGVFLGPVALGYYVVAYRVFTVLNELLVTTINNVALPMFSRLQGEPAALNRAFDRASTSASLLALPAYAGLAIVAGQLIPAVFGLRWGPSVPVLEFLAVAGFAQAQLAFTSSYVIATGRVNREVSWNLAVTAAEIAGFGATVHFGITAVAAALAVVLTTAWPVRLLFLRAWGGLQLSTYFKALLPLAIATAIMSALVLILRALLTTAGIAEQLTLEILAGIIAYPLLLFWLAPSYLRLLRTNLRGLPSKP